MTLRPSPGEARRDGFVITCSSRDVLTCERVRIQSVQHIPVHSSSGFGVGPRDGWGAADLSIAILAALLDASRDPEAYRAPTSDVNERSVWDLHRAFCARWISPLVLGPGEYVELPTSRLEEWVREEVRVPSEPR
jgi:hypothetical protein